VLTATILKEIARKNPGALIDALESMEKEPSPRKKSPVVKERGNAKEIVLGSMAKGYTSVRHIARDTGLRTEKVQKVLRLLVEEGQVNIKTFLGKREGGDTFHLSDTNALIVPDGAYSAVFSLIPAASVKGKCVTGLAREAKIPPPIVNKILDSLQKEGSIVLTPCSNKRGFTVNRAVPAPTLTENGKIILAALHKEGNICPATVLPTKCTPRLDFRVYQAALGDLTRGGFVGTQDKKGVTMIVRKS
jgi:predicted transcriptional regulator